MMRMRLRTGVRVGVPVGLVAALVLGTGALAGCSGGPSAPQWTADAGGTATSQPSGGATPSGSGSPGPASPGSTSTATASAGATAAAWKTYTDPAKSVSFELPQEWIAQSQTPAQGSLPGAVKVEVKDAAGRYLATLQTGLPPRTPASCAPDAAKSYIVVSSVPVDLPHASGDGMIDPHVVYRVIQGYKYFGSYGITNIVGGTGGKACALQNVVRGPEGKGDISFGDLGELTAFAPDQRVAPAKAFDTLAQADAYVNEGSEFANVQRMLMSLRITQ